MNVFTGRNTSKNNTSPIYVNEKLDGIITSSHDHYLSDQLELAQQLSTKDTLLSKEGILGSIHSNYQNLIHKVDYYISGDGHKSKAQSDILDAEMEKEKLERDLKEKLSRESFLKAKLKEYLSVLSLKFKTWTRVKSMLWVMLSLELLVNYKMFALVGGNLLSNLALAGLTCISIFYYAEYIADYLRGITSWIYRLLAALISNIPVILIFVFLAQLRLEYLTAEGNTYTDSIVIVYLLPLINCFVYSVCVNMILKYKPTDQQRESYNLYKIHKDELDLLKTEIQKIRTAITDQDKLLREKIQEHYSYLLLGRNKEREIQTLYKSTFAQYKAELSLRVKPSAVNTLLQNVELPELTLHYQDVQSENLIQS